jgi:hypothetical protein
VVNAKIFVTKRAEGGDDNNGHGKHNLDEGHTAASETGRRI